MGGGKRERVIGEGGGEMGEEVMTWCGVAAYARIPQCGNAG